MISHMPWRLARLFAVLLALTLVAAACGGDDDVETADPAPTEESAVEFPTGRYDDGEGDEQIEFNEDGTFSHFVGQGATPEATGTYSTDGDTITLEDDDGTDCDSPGSYNWSYDGANLVLRVIQDECQGRRASLGQRWTITQ